MEASSSTQKSSTVSLSDIHSCLNVIDICSNRGAFKGEELSTVGKLRDKLALIVEENKPKEEDKE